MAKRNLEDKSLGREKRWDKVFNALVKLTKNLHKDRQFLEDEVKSLHEVIRTMRMEQKVEYLKTEFMLGLKDRDGCIYKHRYEDTDNELADFREWFDYLSQKCSELKDISNDASHKGEGSRLKTLQAEVRMLKSEMEKCKLDKNTEITALLAEKDFVWNQFKTMESDLTQQLRIKRDEVARANEKVQLLVDRADELQMSNEKLRADFAMVESESVQKSEEIKRLLKEIELLKSRSGSSSFSLRHCKTEAAGSHRAGKNSAAGASEPTEKMARTRQSTHKSTGGKAPKRKLTAKGSSSSSKMNMSDIIAIQDTPKLFSSSFKVPKLKSSSSPQIG